MEIWHRIGYSHRDNVEGALESIGVKYEKTHGLHDAYILTLEIAESDAKWPYIAELIKNKTGVNLVWTEFTQQEILSSEWLIARASYYFGHPAPDDSRWNKSYIMDRCTSCGLGWKQVSPFQIKKEPNLKKFVFSSFWGAFELFCRPEVIQIFEEEKIQGYDIQPVLLHKTKKPSQRICQLLIENVANPGIVEEQAENKYFKKTRCKTCDNNWYSHYIRGMMPYKRDSIQRHLDFQQTYEWFGNGRTARREIIVSNRLAELVIEHDWKGLYLLPLQLI